MVDPMLHLSIFFMLFADSPSLYSYVFYSATIVNRFVRSCATVFYCQSPQVFARFSLRQA